VGKIISIRLDAKTFPSIGCFMIQVKAFENHIWNYLKNIRSTFKNGIIKIYQIKQYIKRTYLYLIIESHTKRIKRTNIINTFHKIKIYLIKYLYFLKSLKINILFV